MTRYHRHFLLLLLVILSTVLSTGMLGLIHSRVAMQLKAVGLIMTCCYHNAGAAG